MFIDPQTSVLSLFYRAVLRQEAMALLLVDMVLQEEDMVLQEEDMVLHQEDTVPLKEEEVMVLLLGAIKLVISTLPLVAMATHLLVAMATPKGVTEVLVDTVHQGLTSPDLPYV